MSIKRMPWELVSYICHELDLDDLFNFALSCRLFSTIIRDNNICRTALESNASSAPETQLALQSKEYAKQLRRLVKRKQAITSASPCLAAVVATAESFIYGHGVLVYVSDGLVRILDLHNSVAHETVVDIQGLLATNEDILIKCEAPRAGHEVHLLNYAHGFLTIRYTPRKSVPGWLVVINPAQGTVLTYPLESSRKLFVRNDADFLYYGTHSDVAFDGTRRWALRGCNLHRGSWNVYMLHLTDMVGSDMGHNIYFEIIDGNFYGLANQASFEREEREWTSFYTCVRFPVDQMKPKTTQFGTTQEIWRKFHSEGPIDDRWTFLNLVKDEVTGCLTIVEGRKEWQQGRSASRRTYYTSDLCFTENYVGDTEDQLDSGQDEGGNNDAGDNAVEDEDNDSGSVSSIETDGSGSLSGCPTTERQAPHVARSPHGVHPGDGPLTPGSFTLADTLMRCYHPSSRAFVDLVNDPIPSDPTRTLRPRLRFGSRRLRTDTERKAMQDNHANLTSSALYPEAEIEALYEAAEPALWPPTDWQGTDDLYDVLAPESFQGPVTGTWDERSICYATGSGRSKALVLVSFDPAMQLRGVRSWRAGPVGDDGFHAGPSSSHTCRRDTGAPKETCSRSGEARLATGDVAGVSHEVGWAWVEAPMYASIGKGFHFMS